MPSNESPKKMARRDSKARIRNKSQLTAMKTYRKKFELSVISGEILSNKSSSSRAPSNKTLAHKISSDKILSDKVSIEDAFRKAQSLMARAGRKGLIPKTRASRIIGKMMKKKIAHELSSAA